MRTSSILSTRMAVWEKACRLWRYTIFISLSTILHDPYIHHVLTTHDRGSRMRTEAVQRFRSKLVKDSSTESLFCQGFFKIPELRLLTSNFPSFPVEVSSVFEGKNFFCAQCERSWERSQIKPRTTQQEKSNRAQHRGQLSRHPTQTPHVWS